MKQPRLHFITAIVPVFNEEKTVKNVIRVLLKSNLVNEIICINDGSTDKSTKILQSYKDEVQVISFKNNHGKGYALAKGINAARGDIVVLIDADLTNLSEKYLQTLLKPVLEENYKAVLGYPSNSWTPDLFSDLTGERVYYKKDLLPHLTKISVTRFGVEVYLNNLFPSQYVKKIPLTNLRGLYKYEKRNSKDTLKEYFNEALEVGREIGKKEIVSPAVNFKSWVFRKIYD